MAAEAGLRTLAVASLLDTGGPAGAFRGTCQYRQLVGRDSMKFEILGEIEHVETIAVGTGVRVRALLNKAYGPGRWRKRKGFARVRLASGTVRRVELHWYEAHGIGRRDFKIKAYVD